MEILKDAPPLIQGLAKRGYRIEVSHHQDNDFLTCLMEDVLKAVPMHSKIQILTETGAQDYPATVWAALKGNSFVICAFADQADALNSYNMLFVNPDFEIVQVDPKTGKRSNPWQ